MQTPGLVRPTFPAPPNGKYDSWQPRNPWSYHVALAILPVISVCDHSDQVPMPSTLGTPQLHFLRAIVRSPRDHQEGHDAKKTKIKQRLPSSSTLCWLLKRCNVCFLIHSSTARVTEMLFIASWATYRAKERPRLRPRFCLKRRTLPAPRAS